MMSTAHPMCPLELWDESLQQGEITLNQLHRCPHNPKISSYEAIHGAPYDFLHHPLAPFGTRVIIHETPKDRASWAPHGIPGFYLGPAMDHYRCFRVFASPTESIRISDSIAWYPQPYPMPGSSALEGVHSAITDLDGAIEHLASVHSEISEQRQPVMTKGAEATERLRAMLALYQSPSVQLTEREATPQPPAAGGTVEVPDIPPLQTQTIVTASATDVGTLQVAPILATVPNEPKPRRSRRIPQHPRRYANYIARTTYGHCNSVAARHLGSDPHSMREAKAMPGLRDTWIAAEADEFRRLVTDTGCCQWIKPTDKPRERQASYYNPQPKIKGTAEAPIYRVRGTYGGDRGDYCGETTALVAAMTAVKINLNAMVSEDANWMTIDISDYYLGTPMEKPEYMILQRHQIPSATIASFNLEPLFQEDKIMLKVVKAIYGLKQAGKLAQDRLIEHLAKHGYHQMEHTPCAFYHETRSTTFTLVVDDFGIKYQGNDDALHLISTLEKQYKIKVDMDGSMYLGITIALDKPNRKVTLSMPGYVEKALKRFNITKASRDTHSPAIYTTPVYGQQQQQATPEDTSEALDADRSKTLSQMIGVWIYYAAAIDSSMKTTIGKLASRQAKPTVNLWTDMITFNQYAATWPNATVTFHASDMRLKVHSDASYLSETLARSRAAGYIYLGTINEDAEETNGAIEIVCTIIKSIVSSACEAEYAALFINGQIAECLRNTLSDFGYQQGPTPIITDNKAAEGIATRSLKQRKSKAIDMRFHWIRDRVDQNHFKIIWKKGKLNKADFFTKIHPIKHFKEMRNVYVAETSNDQFKGCVRTKPSRLVGRLPAQGKGTVQPCQITESHTNDDLQIGTTSYDEH